MWQCEPIPMPVSMRKSAARFSVHFAGWRNIERGKCNDTFRIISRQSMCDAGAAIMCAGTVIEGLADWQKQAAKRDDAGRLVTTGLYRRWRHPNYAGEILLQLGLIIAGLWSVSTLGDALVVVIAPSYIVILMVAEAFRVDKEQELKYGTGDEYKAWRGASGSLVPRF